MAEEVIISVPVEDAPAAPAATETPDEVIAKLSKQVEEHKAHASRLQQERDGALARASEVERSAAGKVKQAETTVAESEYAAVVNGLASANAEADQLAAQHAKALADGDFDAAGKLQVRIGRIAARIEKLEDGKAAMEAGRSRTTEGTVKAATTAAPREGDGQTATPEQQRERWLASLPPRSADWIRKHPQYFTDMEFQGKVQAAAVHAERILGLSAFSDEYFNRIEEAVGLKSPESPRTAEPTREVPRTEPARTAAAPAVAVRPERSTPSAPGTRSEVQVSLTPAEVEIARLTLTRDVIGDQDPLVVFARNKQAAMREGKWRSP